MRKPTVEQAGKFMLFASPCYWTLAVLFIVLVIWKVGFSEPDLIPVTLVSIAVIAAAVLLTKKYYWISLPMIALGVYIATREDQFLNISSGSMGRI